MTEWIIEFGQQIAATAIGVLLFCAAAKAAEALWDRHRRRGVVFRRWPS